MPRAAVCGDAGGGAAREYEKAQAANESSRNDLRYSRGGTRTRDPGIMSLNLAECVGISHS